ncbi:MAG: hypothetical protein RR263_04775 [Oscillospiraceae bacterium]
MEQKQDNFQMSEKETMQKQGFNQQKQYKNSLLKTCKGDIDDFIYGNDTYCVSQR